MAFVRKELNASQKQAVMKVTEKKDYSKRLIKNCRPKSLLNDVELKLISNALSNRIKNVLPNLILFNQNAYVINRFISEGNRVIYNILEMTDILTYGRLSFNNGYRESL